jgi:putative chitobiose transport system permease protein
MIHRPSTIRILYYLLGTLFVLLAVGPALWLANIALQPASAFHHGKLISYDLSDLTHPSDYTSTNFVGAWKSGLFRPLINSIVVTAVQTVLNVLLAALCAYPLARMRFAGRKMLLTLVLMTLLVPEQIIAVPLFVTIVHLGLFDTLTAVFLPFSVTAFGIYLCQQGFAAIPADIEEACRIDGANAFGIWWHVMLPLTRPTLVTLAVFSVIGAWSNLLWPLIVLEDDQKYTLPVAINQLLSVFGDNVRLAYAASLLALLPLLLVYALAQRWLQRGMLAGAVKG